MSKRRFQRVALLLAGISFMFALDVAPALAVEVTFQDPFLEQIVRDRLAIPAPAPITDVDMLELTDVIRPAGSTSSITSLSGLEYAVNLNFVGLPDSQIADLSPLSGLTNLRFVDLRNNQISDISPLGASKHWEDLRLDNNQVSDVSPLAGSEMWFLHISNNQISDVTPFSDIDVHFCLDLSGNRIRDVAPAGWYSIPDTLLLGDNLISDISSLSDFPGMEGEGGGLDLCQNYLDLSAGSDTMDIIEGTIPNCMYADQKSHQQQGQELCEFVEAAAGSGDLVGLGNKKTSTAKLQLLVKKLNRGADLLGQGDYAEALDVLSAALGACDGADTPKDSVGGAACAELDIKLTALIERATAEQP